MTKKKRGEKTPIKKSITPTATTKDSTTITIVTLTPTDTTTKIQSSTSTTTTEQSSTPIEPMDMTINLKRRRNSEDSPTKEGEKRNPKKTTQQQTPSLPQPKGEGKKKIAKSPATNERPAQIIPPLPQKQKITPINPIEIPLPPHFPQSQLRKFSHGHTQWQDSHLTHRQHQHHHQVKNQEHARLQQKPAMQWPLFSSAKTF